MTMTTTDVTPGAALWTVDAAHSNVEFAVKHLMIATVKGRFARVEGTVELDDRDLSRASIAVTIDAASIDTRVEQRDQHLRSPDFFDVARFPTIEFRSKGVEVLGEGRLRISGALTMHGVTRDVVIDAAEEGRTRDPWGGDRAGFSASAKLSRKDFGLTWNQLLETGGLAVGDDIRISLDVELVRQPGRLAEQAA
jgi:polyisoprenoid-binding protein YceI